MAQNAEMLPNTHNWTGNVYEPKIRYSWLGTLIQSAKSFSRFRFFRTKIFVATRNFWSPKICVFMQYKSWNLTFFGVKYGEPNRGQMASKYIVLEFRHVKNVCTWIGMLLWKTRFCDGLRKSKKCEFCHFWSFWLNIVCFWSKKKEHRVENRYSLQKPKTSFETCRELKLTWRSQTRC